MKKILITIVAILTVSIGITACNSDTTDSSASAALTVEAEEAEEAKEAEFSFGSWDASTFTSPFLNISITFPEDVVVATDEQIKERTNVTHEMLQDNELFDETQSQMTNLLTKYDFIVVLSDQKSNIQLIHENVSLAASDKDMAVKDYIQGAVSELSKLPFEYKFEDTETVTLGGQEFTKLSSTAAGGSIIQDYYVISNGKYISSLIFTYSPDSAKSAASIISGITAAD